MLGVSATEQDINKKNDSVHPPPVFEPPKLHHLERRYHRLNHGVGSSAWILNLAIETHVLAAKASAAGEAIIANGKKATHGDSCKQPYAPSTTLIDTLMLLYSILYY